MNYTNIKADIHFLCGSSSATFSDADINRRVNVHYQDVATKIWDSSDGWSFDDANNTDSPIAYKTLANASATYVIPTTALRIKGVELKDNAGDWHITQPVTYQYLRTLDVSPEEYFSTPGLPLYHEIEGNEIRLFPPPGTGYVTMASGMLVRLSRAVTEFPVTATTQTPGFATAFHQYLSVATALDFIKDDKQRQWLINQKDRIERGLTRFYAHRAEELPGAVTPMRKRLWRLWL